MYAVGEDGPGRRLGHGVVVDHPSPHHVTVESPFGTKRVAAISHVSLSTVETKPPVQTSTAVETPAQKWAALCDAVDERITAYAHWPALAAQLDRAAAAGTDIGAVLHQVTADDALPDDHPARSLAYRVADVVPDLRSPARMRTDADPDPAPRTARPPLPPPPSPAWTRGCVPARSAALKLANFQHAAAPGQPAGKVFGQGGTNRRIFDLSLRRQPFESPRS